MFDDYGDAYATEHWGKKQASDAANQKNTYVKFYNKQELKDSIIHEITKAKHQLKNLPHSQHLDFLMDKLCLKIYTT